MYIAMFSQSRNADLSSGCLVCLLYIQGITQWDHKVLKIYTITDAALSHKEALLLTVFMCIKP